MIKMWQEKITLPGARGRVPNEAAFVFKMDELAVLHNMFNIAVQRVDKSTPYGRVIDRMAAEICEIWEDEKHDE